MASSLPLYTATTDILENDDNDDDEFVCSAIKALELRFITFEEDIPELRDGEDDEGKAVSSSMAYSPLFSHQSFGNSEKVFGYKDLRIHLWFSAGGLRIFTGLNYSERANPALNDGVPPDDITAKLHDVLDRGGYTTDLSTFHQHVEDDRRNFRPFGKLLHCYDSTALAKGKYSEAYSQKCKLSYEVYQCNEATDADFLEYFNRLQALLFFFIDGAQFLEFCDNRWHIYLLFEKFEVAGDVSYRTVGMTSVYNFFHYPDKIRTRISQVMILPPYQGRSHGSRLYNVIMSDLLSRPEVVDVTVEDPTDNFLRVRDAVDVQHWNHIFKGKTLPFELTIEIEMEVKLKLKFSDRQIRHIFDLIHYKTIRSADEATRHRFRLKVKARLRNLYIESLPPFKDEPEEHKRVLGELFDAEIDHFDQVIKRLELLDEI